MKRHTIKIKDDPRESNRTITRAVDELTKEKRKW